MNSRLLIRPDAQALRLQWFGELTVSAVEEATAEVRELHLPTRVWLDLLAVTACPLAVRPLLVEFHRGVQRRTERRVWIAASPKLRAMGSWIAHMTEDDDMRVVSTSAQGAAWLASTEARLEPAKRGIQDFLEWRRAQ